MLYIFLVDTGRMLHLEMDLALEEVSKLKSVLERQCDIPSNKQVLLISGGETLDDENGKRVCDYSAVGTDTNPIFLFSLKSIEESNPPLLGGGGNSLQDSGDDSADELDVKTESSMKLPDAQSTVSVRAAIAQEFVKASAEQIRICEGIHINPVITNDLL